MEINGTSEVQSSAVEPWDNRQLLEWLYVAEGHTQREIAERFDCAHSTIGSALRKHDIKRPWHDYDTLYELYVEAGLTMAKVAEELGCDQATISRNLRDLGIETRGHAEHGLIEGLQDREALREMHVDRKMRTSKIADHFGCTPRTVTHYLNEYDIERLDLPSAEAVTVLESEAELRRLYCDNELTQDGIAGELGCGQMSVSRALKRHGIPVREAYQQATPKSNAPEIGYYGPQWSERRDEARERDGHVCQRCGLAEESHLDEYGMELAVHHIEAFRSFTPFESVSDYERANRLENLITLCCACHRTVEDVPIDNRQKK